MSKRVRWGSHEDSRVLVKIQQKSQTEVSNASNDGYEKAFCATNIALQQFMMLILIRRKVERIKNMTLRSRFQRVTSKCYSKKRDRMLDWMFACKKTCDKSVHIIDSYML